MAEKAEKAKAQEIDLNASYPGVQPVVTPEDAEYLKEHHPQYDFYEPIIKARLKQYNEAVEINAKHFKVKEPDDGENSDVSEGEPTIQPVTPATVSTTTPAVAEKPKATTAGGK